MNRHSNAESQFPMRGTHRGTVVGVAIAVALFASVFFYIFYLSAYFPLPHLDNFFAPERKITSSTLPLKHKWTFNSDNTLVYTPFADSNRVVIRTFNSLIGIDANRGQMVWEVPAGAVKQINVYLSSEADKLVYTSFNDKNLNAMNLATGQPYWSVEMSGVPDSITSLATNSSTAFVGVGRSFQPLRGFSLETGVVNWIPIPKATADITHPLSLEEDLLYAFLGIGLYVYDANNGRLLRELPNFVGSGTAVSVKNHIAYMWYESAFIAKDTQTGRVLWRYNREPSFYTIGGDRVIVFTNCCTLAALETATGEVIWEKKISTQAVAPIVILENIAYLMGQDGSIVGFNMENGAEVGRIDTRPNRVNYFNKQVGMYTDSVCLYATFGDKQLFAFC